MPCLARALFALHVLCLLIPQHHSLSSSPSLSVFVPLSLLASSTFPLHPYRLMLQPHHGHVFFFSTHPTICSWTFEYYSKNDCSLKEIKNKYTHTHTSTKQILKDASKGNRHSLTRIIPLKPFSWIHPVT